MKELTLREYRETYEESAVLNEFANSAKRRVIYFSLMPNPPARVLEIGCAEGVFSAQLANEGFNAISMDISHRFINRAKEHAVSSCSTNNSFCTADAERLPFREESFDVVVMTEVIEHLRCPIIALQEIWRVLKEKGIFIISTPNSATVSNFLCNLFLRGFKRDPGVLHVTIFDTRQLIKTLKFIGFDVLTIKGMGLNFPILSKSHILASVFDSGAKFIPQIAETIILKTKKSKPVNTKQIIKRLK